MWEAYLVAMRQTLFLLIVISVFQVSLGAQEVKPRPPSRVLISTYPLRYIYGPNLQATVTLGNQHQLSLHYQFHNRDFFGVRSDKDVLGLSAVPRLLNSDGHALYASYLFPGKRPHRWQGPKLGLKQVDGYLDEEGYPDHVGQTNIYALFTQVYRTSSRGFYIELYYHAGLVFINKSEHEFEAGYLTGVKNYPLSVLPHLLAGFAVGFGL